MGGAGLAFAAYTKSKPRVRAYMLEHRAAVEQQLVEQDTQELRRFNVGRDQVLTRLWEIANMDPERTRNGMSAQVKAIAMIVAIEGLIPDRHSARRAVSAQNQPAQPQEEGTAPDLQSAPTRADGPPPVSSPTPHPTPNLSESSFFGGALNPFQETSSVPRVPMADYFAPDTRVPFSIPKNPFADAASKKMEHAWLFVLNDVKASNFTKNRAFDTQPPDKVPSGSPRLFRFPSHK